MLQTMRSFFSTNTVSSTYGSMGLLVLRVAVALLMLTHGIAKMSNFSAMSVNFDPIGIGGGLSLSLVVFAEVFCSIGLLLGLLTRAAALALVINMLVAVLVAHSGDPLATKELGLMYLACYCVLLLTGPGKYSLDKLIWK